MIPCTGKRIRIRNRYSEKGLRGGGDHIRIRVVGDSELRVDTEGSPNLSVYRVRTVAYRTLPFSARDRFWSTAQRTVLF
jgi:hypothetical protein